MINSVKQLLNRILFLFFYGYLFLKMRKNDLYIICEPLIGDTCYALSYSQCLNKIGNITYIIGGNNRNLIEYCYKAYFTRSNVKYYDIHSFVSKFYVTKAFSEKFYFFLRNKGIVFACPIFYYSPKDIVNEDYFQFLKNIPYNVINGSPNITFPSVPKCEINAIKNFNSIKSRVVLLNPYSNSMKSVSNLFWEYIADTLKEKGYYVYTNVIKNQKEISGTQRLDCSIFELYNICQEIPLFISIRSGIIDFTVSSACKKLVIWYRSENAHNVENLCNVEAWGIEGITQINYDNLQSSKVYFNKYIECL